MIDKRCVVDDAIIDKYDKYIQDCFFNKSMSVDDMKDIFEWMKDGMK